VDDLIIKAQRMHESFIRIRDVVVSQQAALAEQAQEQRFKGLNGFNAEDPNGYQDDLKGGFAGSDPKKRRGVSFPFPLHLTEDTDKTTSEPLHLVVATVVTEPRPPNGEEDLMARGHFATLVVCVSRRGYTHRTPANIRSDYAKLTRKMGTNKAAVSSSNLRPKSMGPGSPI